MVSRPVSISFSSETCADRSTGVGDTMMGVLMAGLVKGDRRLEDLIPIAQQAAVKTLKSAAAVSPAVQELRLDV